MASPLAAIGVLTQSPQESSLNRRMAESFVLAPAEIWLRWVLWEEEARAKRWEARKLSNQRVAVHSVPIAVVERPAFVTRRHEWECVAKILAWLAHAHTTTPSTAAFIGWADSDTWFLPQRLHAFLLGVARHVDQARFAWIGTFMHWARYAPEHLDGFGFMHDSANHQEPQGFELKLDHKRNLKYLAEHQRALRGSAAARRRLGFAMAQGAFVTYGRAALARVLKFAQASDEARAFLGLPPARNSSGEGGGGSRKTGGSCVLPTDVGLGWLTTRTFRGSSELRVVSMLPLMELFVWPSSRVNANHTVVLHLAGSKAGNFSKLVGYWDAMLGGRSLTPPTFACAPTTWLHADAKEWSTCTNWAQCAAWRRRGPRPKAGGRPAVTPEDGWMPTAARGICEARARAGKASRRA